MEGSRTSYSTLKRETGNTASRDPVAGCGSPARKNEAPGVGRGFKARA